MARRKNFEARLLSNEKPDTAVSFSGNMAGAVMKPSNVNNPEPVRIVKDLINASITIDDQAFKTTQALQQPELRNGVSNFNADSFSEGNAALNTIIPVDGNGGVFNPLGVLPLSGSTATPGIIATPEKDLVGDDVKNASVPENNYMIFIVVALVALLLFFIYKNK